MIYIDVDGVIRDLCFGAWGNVEVTHWDFEVNGKGIVDTIDANPEILVKSPPTEYLECLSGLDHVIFLTAQRPNWIEFTHRWLKMYVPIQWQAIITRGPDDKERRLVDGDILIDDYPGFKSFDRIALLDRPYNRHIDVPLRITDKNGFMEVLRAYA